MELFIGFVVIVIIFKLIGAFSKDKDTKREIDESIERAWYGSGGKNGAANKIANALFGIIILVILGFILLLTSG